MSGPQPGKTGKTKSRSVAVRKQPLVSIAPGDEAGHLRRRWNFNARLRDAREVERFPGQALRAGSEPGQGMPAGVGRPQASAGAT